MASIKVTYGQTSRKFTIASDSTWKEFESQLHHLFDIPNETSISVSYIDEDGDVITLSTDSELHQILSDQELFGANVKFNVYTSENPDNNNNGWILEDAEGKDDSVVTLSDDDESTSNKVDEIVAYKIGEPNEPNENENENTETDQITNVQTEEQQPAVEIDYPHVTVTDERDDPLFKPTITNENQSEQPEESLIPVDSVNEEKEQPQESVTESSNNTEKSSSTSSDENKKEESEESETDPNIIFIISSSPWIQRTYYRPRVNLFEGLLNDYPTYPTYFSHFARPRYSYITPSCGFRRHPYFGSRRFITSRYNGFGGGLCNLY